MARRADSDFMLLDLIENPAMNPNISVYYLGWDRTSSSATSGVCIHHPKGAQKKISVTTNSINNYSSTICWGLNCSQGTSPANTHWKVDFTNGTAEGGSSGSPMLNQNRRVIGQLHGGGSDCPPDVIKVYGRLDVSWDGGETSTTRLKDWLDPQNIGAITVDGKCGSVVNFHNQTINNTQTIEGCEVNVQGVTINSGANVTITGYHGVEINSMEVAVGASVEINGRE